MDAETHCIVCGAKVDEHSMAPEVTLPEPGGRRDLAAEAVAIARGELVIRPEREHVVELLHLLEMRQAAIVQLIGGTPPELHS